MLASYISGIVATLTPCTIVMIPIFLYRFGIWGEAKSRDLYKSLLLTLIGFFFSLFIIGLVFNHLIGSTFSNGIRLILGTSLVAIGILQVFNKFNLSLLQNVSNSFLLGMIMPWGISFSPCVIPIFSTFFVNGIQSADFVVNILFFGLGMLSPALLTAFIGKSFFSKLKTTGGIIGRIEKFSGLIVILSGIYLSFQILNIGLLDIILASLIFSIVLAGSAYFVFIVKKKYSAVNIILFLSFLTLWSAVVFNCYSIVNSEESSKQPKNHIACSAHQEGECEICTRCASLFLISATLGVSGFLLSQKKIQVIFGGSK